MPAILAVFLPEVIDPQLVAGLTRPLPPFAQQEIERYVHVEDQLRSAVGKWLIHTGVAGGMGLPADTLAAWKTDQYGRPSLPGKPAFNLTHSGRVVALAYRLPAEQNAALGLDVERIKRLDFELFGPYMSEPEWLDIRRADDPETRFFHYWTAKEAVMKAEGLGFHLPIADIFVEGSLARVGNRQWHLEPLPLRSGYAAHLATPEAKPQPSLQWLNAETWLDASA